MPSDLNSLLAPIVFGENTMNGKNIVGGQTGPITQSVDAVKALLSFKKVASDPLPQEVSLDGGRLVLVLSNKKDAFYTVTARACSCPRKRNKNLQKALNPRRSPQIHLLTWKACLRK